jgi:pimeloyl-ACP methyl ester carboxylesterase
VLFSAAVLLLLSVAPRLTSPEDTLLDVGGYRMHLVVHRGTTPLTIVMESGGGASLEAWAGVDSQLAQRTGATVVAYDRAGFGRSEAGPSDLMPEQQARQLSRALDRLRTPSARLVIGHSYGGLLALLHAHLYPDRVRGLVLVDPMNPRFVRATGDFVHVTVPHIEHPATRKDTAVARMVAGFDRLVASPSAGDADLRLPIVIVTAGEAWWGKPEIDREWRASHEAMAKAAPHRRLLVAERSKHDIPEKRPDTIIEAVVSLIERADAVQEQGAAPQVR